VVDILTLIRQQDKPFLLQPEEEQRTANPGSKDSTGGSCH